LKEVKNESGDTFSICSNRVAIPLRKAGISSEENTKVVIFDLTRCNPA